MAINTVQELLDAIDEIYRAEVRKQMDNDVHAIVFNNGTFNTLVKLHITEVKEVARKADDPTIKALLQDNLPNIRSLTTKLQKRFEEILESELNRRKSIRYKKIKRNTLTEYIIQPNPSKRSPQVNVFKRIQETMSEVKKRLVEQSQSGSLDRVLSVIIAGIDADRDKVTGAYGKFAKSKTVDTNPFSDAGVQRKGAGAQLGHTRGPGTVKSRLLFELIREVQSNIVGPTNIQFKTSKLVDLVHRYDANMKLNNVAYELATGSLDGIVDISILTLEQTARNSFEGTLAKRTIEKKLVPFLRKNAAKILTEQGSKPILTSLSDDVVKLFEEGKVSKKKYNKRYKSKNKLIKGKAAASRLVIGGKGKSALKTRANKQLRQETASLDIPSLIGLINSRLHDQIQKNMGAGKSKQKLNYRTGRFARSAKLEALIPTKDKNAMAAEVSYMKHPYSVFEKGGRLYKPLRDPAGIFGRSIRQILQEEKIATLRQVQVNLTDG